MGLFSNRKRNMVVSVDAILESKGIRGRAAPRQQLQALRALSRMVQREELNVTAVIAGKPLNKAPENQTFEGVRVRYVDDETQVGPALLKAMRQAGCAGVLVTEDAALEEKILQGGKDTLRISTFRKLLDDGSEDYGMDGGRDRNGGRKNRRDRNDRKKPRRNNTKEDKKSQERDEISQMIDLVE